MYQQTVPSVVLIMRLIKSERRAYVTKPSFSLTRDDAYLEWCARRRYPCRSFGGLWQQYEWIFNGRNHPQHCSKHAPTTSSSSGLIKTATATVKGTSETILINSQGLTLYYRTSDAPPSTVCSGGCAGVWPPLVVSGLGAPTSAASLPGKLTVVADANGKQVEYNGHPLYTYSGDTSPGQTTGEGIGGVWHVCTPNLT